MDSFLLSIVCVSHRYINCLECEFCAQEAYSEIHEIYNCKNLSDLPSVNINPLKLPHVVWKQNIAIIRIPS